MNEFIIGLDLGKTQDYTALAVLEKIERQAQAYPACHLRHLQRFPLNTPYSEIAEQVANLLDIPPLTRRNKVGEVIASAQLVVDATGVGAPVLEILRQHRLTPIEVLIHGGAQVTRRGGRQFSVPKRDLITGLQVAFQERQLLIAAELPDAPTLVNELMTVDYRLTPAANDVFVHREGSHDDLVLAVALAHWYAVGRERHGGGGYIVIMGNGL